MSRILVTVIAMSMLIVKKLSSIKIKLGMWTGPAWLGVASPPPGQGGQSLTEIRKFPFIVGWNQYGLESAGQLACTGSLITPHYFLSASHCNNILIDKDRDKVASLTIIGLD